MKLKILSIIAVVVISAVGVGFTNKEETIELVNDITITLNDDQSTISYYLLEDYFTMTDDEIFVTLDGEKFDITQYCRLDSEDCFTYEKQFGDYIQRIVISGEPNTKVGILWITSLEDTKTNEIVYNSYSKLFNIETNYIEDRFCCDEEIPIWVNQMNEFTNNL